MKFKAGDRVRIIDWPEVPEGYGPNCWVGVEGEVTKVYNSRPRYTVREDSNKGADAEALSFFEQELEFIIKPNTQLLFSFMYEEG